MIILVMITIIIVIKMIIKVIKYGYSFNNIDTNTEVNVLLVKLLPELYQSRCNSPAINVNRDTSS